MNTLFRTILNARFGNVHPMHSEPIYDGPIRKPDHPTLHKEGVMRTFLRRLPHPAIRLIALACLFTLFFIGQANAQGFQTISIGDTIHDTVQSSYGDEWYFYGYAGQAITVRMNSNVFDTYLNLYDPSWNLLCSDDDSGGNYNALIRTCWLPSTGLYTIVAKGYGGATGPYQLSLQVANADCGTPGRHIAYGALVDGSTFCASGTRWTFHGSRGDWVRITMRSTNMDSYLELYAPDGRQIAWNDDGAGFPDALIYLSALPQSGTYTIVARGYDGDTGSYTLRLE